jgi:hypothetical protein
MNRAIAFEQPHKSSLRLHLDTVFLYEFSVTQFPSDSMVP